VNLRGAFWAFGLAFLMLVAAFVSYGLNAPNVVGDLFLVAMVAFAVVGFIVGARGVSRFKANTRVVQAQRGQQRGQEKASWED
jgi:hypothetical protein